VLATTDLNQNPSMQRPKHDDQHNREKHGNKEANHYFVEQSADNDDDRKQNGKRNITGHLGEYFTEKGVELT
jgi:hypothetical protein